MKLSQGFWQTYKETPADAEVPSHKLMIRAGLIQKAAAGLYTYLPLGLRAIQKVEKIVREELNAVGCYELSMRVMTPGELWQESGRWGAMGPEMLKVKDRSGRDLCISPTNEESVVDVFRRVVKSYKQLPVTLYQINTKFRDEIRPRYGIMRSCEFTMKDGYSFHIDKASLEETYNKMFKTYERIFSRMGLEFIAVEADGGAMADGESQTHEFQVLAGAGEDKVIQCLACKYAANIEKAETLRKELTYDLSKPELSEVATPGQESIEEVSSFLKVSSSSCLKSVVYAAVTGEKEEYILAQLLGDDEINEVKLKGLLSCEHLVPATETDLEKIGLDKGYIGPMVADKKNMRIIYDSAVNLDGAYVTGAKSDKHFTGFVPNRDDSEIEVADLRTAVKGDSCGKCKDGTVDEIRGVEVGHIFHLGDKYTKAMNVTVLDNNGRAVTPIMGCYGIGTTRTVAGAIEQHHDEKGIIWPKAIAPYHAYLAIIGKSEEIMKLGTDLYEELNRAGVETILDDRKAGAGFKFKDADLLGLPIQVVLGERDYNNDGMIEIKIRKTGESKKVSRDRLVDEVKKTLEGIN